jgi:hypothetical protein
VLAFTVVSIEKFEAANPDCPSEEEGGLNERVVRFARKGIPLPEYFDQAQMVSLQIPRISSQQDV